MGFILHIQGRSKGVFFGGANKTVGFGHTPLGPQGLAAWAAYAFRYMLNELGVWGVL